MDILTFILLSAIFIATCWFLNRFMNERKEQREYLRRELHINSNTTNVEPSAASEEQFKKFDDRLNKTWESISGIKMTLESLKLQLGLKGKN